MTLAVLCGAVDNQLEPGSAADLARDLTAALRAAGAHDVRRPGTNADADAGPDVAADLRALAVTARELTEPLLLCVDDLVTHSSLLWTLATEPAGRSTVLVIPDEERGDLRQERGRLVSATGAAATVRFLGALCVAPGDLTLLADAAERAAVAYEAAVGTISVGAPAGGPGTGLLPARSAVDALLPALLDAGLVPIATRVRLLHAERVTDDAGCAAARAAIAAVDEDAARLRLAVKEQDDFFTTYAVSTWSPWVTKVCARLGLTPSGVTVLSLVFAVAAALAFWQASRPAMIAGAVLLYLGFVLDCVDGQLARYIRRFGAFGGWLDTMADRAKEYAAYAGLAAGADRIGLPGAWPLAITAMLVQTVRHMTDTWYGALHDEAAARQSTGSAGHDAAGTSSARSGSDPLPGLGLGWNPDVPAGPDAPVSLGARLSRASNRVQADTGSVAYWLKRIVVFPIGERWALIAVLAAVANGRVALLAVVAWGLLAAAYTLALRSVRALSMRVPVLETVDRSRHRDDGMLVRRLLGRAGWPAPLALAALAAVAAGALVAAVLTGLVSRGAAARSGVGAAGWSGIGADHGPGFGAAGLALLVTAVLVLAAGLPARTRHGGALDWLVPAALRAAEYLVVVAVGLIGAVPPPVVFALLFALSLHHYDLTARMEKGAPERGAPPARLGWDGRVLLLVAAALAGVALPTMALLVGVVAGAFVVGALADWRTPRQAAPHPAGSGSSGGAGAGGLRRGDGR